MQTNYCNRQLAVVLRDNGLIKNIITNSFHDLEVHLESMFINVIHEDSHNVYLDFLSHISIGFSPNGFQLKLVNDADVFVFFIKNKEVISLFVMEVEPNAEALFDEIQKINNDATNSLRKLSKKIVENTDSQILFEEVMMLNSSLINARRELSNKNGRTRTSKQST